jgi:hypothetical protein
MLETEKKPGNKKDLMQNLISDLSQNTDCENIRRTRNGSLADLSLINQFNKRNFIPNKWFDWVNRVDAPIMIIGQDWGPYLSLKKYFDDYEISVKKPDFNYDDFLFKTFSSRTEKFIIKAIKKTYSEKYGNFNKEVYDSIIFTMAVLFTRQGKHFRGNENFDEKSSFEICYPYVKRQIEIVKPKIIMTLGGLAFKVVDQFFELGFSGKNLTEVVKTLKDNIIRKSDTIIIPNFHPASHIDPQIQLKIWEKIWEYIKV